MENGTQRLIIATCEKGTVEDVADMRGIKEGLDQIRKENPNMVDVAANRAWISYKPEIRAQQPVEPKGFMVSKNQSRNSKKKRDPREEKENCIWNPKNSEYVSAQSVLHSILRGSWNHAREFCLFRIHL
ncbi:MAG: hypothetical protein IPG02_00290 [Ignavibacteria bacterium]|nr:hypothetical protein [Ignavibacteria bacterium]